MGLLDWLFQKPDPAVEAQKAASQARQAEILAAIKARSVPASISRRLTAARTGAVPWIATLTPAELRIARTHGMRPISTVSATCWMQYGWSWTEGHAQGWRAALSRLRAEAKAAGANAVVDVKLRTVALELSDSMDFTLVGTAVQIDGLPPSENPVVATVPALEFVKLLEADVVPTGIAVGAHYEWLVDWQRGTNLRWMGNIECEPLSQLWHTVRQRAQQMLRQNGEALGNGVLAHVNFRQIFEVEQDNRPKQYLARQIIVATTVDAKRAPLSMDVAGKDTHEKRRISTLNHYRGTPVPLEFQMVVDMCAGATPLARRAKHHQSYGVSDTEIEDVSGSADDDDNDGAI